MMVRRGKQFLLASSALVLLHSPAFGQSAPGAVQSTNVETILITGRRNQAAEVKKNAPVVLDIAPLEQIRSLPDANAAEALQRLPGISMESDSGAGRFVNIRGMDADLNGTTYDGVRMMANNPASPQGGARAVALDAFPAGFFGGLEVIKTLNPSMDAEGLGGVVNIQPRTLPAGQDHIFDAALAGGIETLRPTGLFNDDITVGKRFLGGKLSVIFSYAIRKDSRAIDDIEADYFNDPTVVPPGTSPFLAQKAFDDVQYRWYQYRRTRQGFGGGVTFDPSDSTELYLRGFHAGYVETANKQEFVLNGLADNIASVDNATGNFTSSGVSPYYADINTKEKLGNSLIEFGGKTVFANNIKLDARGSWTRGSDEFPYSINARFVNPDGVDVIYNNTNANRPTYQALGGVDLTDPTPYALDANHGGNGPSKNRDEEYAGVTDLTVPLNIGGEGGLVAFGGSVRLRSRSAQAYNAGFAVDALPLSDYVSGPDNIYYNGWYNIGPKPIYDKLLSIPQTALIADPSTYEKDNENIYAGYVQYSSSFGALDMVGGVRVEATDGTYRANQFVTVPDPNDPENTITTMSPNTTKHRYTNVFPDLSFKYAYNDAVQFRAAFSTAIARPGFNQITAARTINYNNATIVVSQGNPDLKPTLGHNFDLMASYYMPHGGVASVGLFYKSFSNYIISTESPGATDVPGFAGQAVNLFSFSNIGSAHAEGVELNFERHFEFLPGPLQGLGFEGNLTYVKSSGVIRVYPDGTKEKHTLPQTSPFNYNAALLYDRGPVSLKLAASYVGTNLWAVGGDPSTDLYSQPRFRLDFGASYKINKHAEAFFDMKNITNTHLEFTQTDNKNFPVQNEFYRQDFLFGVRVNF